MSILEGISVQLHVRHQTGTDAFKRPVYEDSLVTVDNVLIYPSGSEDRVSSTNVTGMSEEYTLCLPRGDAYDWANASVDFWGETWQTVGRPQNYIDKLLPLKWNKRVQVRRHE